MLRCGHSYPAWSQPRNKKWKMQPFQAWQRMPTILFVVEFSTAPYIQEENIYIINITTSFWYNINISSSSSSRSRVITSMASAPQGTHEKLARSWDSMMSGILLYAMVVSADKRFRDDQRSHRTQSITLNLHSIQCNYVSRLRSALLFLFVHIIHACTIILSSELYCVYSCAVYLLLFSRLPRPSIELTERLLEWHTRTHVMVAAKSSRRPRRVPDPNQ